MSSKSEIIFEKALQFLPGGVSRNAVFSSPYPRYALKAEGFNIIDIEGNKSIDFANNMASLIHGHAHPEIIKVVTEQMLKGTAYSMATEVEVMMAEHICKRNSSFEKIRFLNSGTEAVMVLIKLARAFTGKTKVAKIEGAYHGVYDFAEVSQTASPKNWGDSSRPNSVPVALGTPDAILNDVVVFGLNNSDKTLKILEEKKSDIALVLIDPVPHRAGLNPATEKFISDIYNWTRKNNALLGFDEVITFRHGYGGAQEMYSVKPDLTALGKIIGGGFPVGAIAGKSEIMMEFDPRVEPILVPQSGTFSANPVSMSAGLKSMELFGKSEVERLNLLGERARNQIGEAIKLVDIPACVSGYGSMFRIHFKKNIPLDYRAAYLDDNNKRILSKFLKLLYNEGFLLINSGTGTISTPMTNCEIDKLSEGVLKSLKKIKKDVEQLQRNA